MMINFDLYPKRIKNVLSIIVELTKLVFRKAWLHLANERWSYWYTNLNMYHIKKDLSYV